MRSRGSSPCMLFLCASLAALGAMNCTDNKTQPMPLAPVEPVAFSVHVSYCKDAAPGPDVAGTLVQLVQGSTTLEATTDENGRADFGEVVPGLYELTASRATAFEEPLCLNGGDVNVIIQLLDGIRPLGACGLVAADVLQDGGVTLADLQALRRFMVFDFAAGGSAAQWRFVDLAPQIDLREATTLEVHAVLLGDTDLSWPSRLDPQP